MEMDHDAQVASPGSSRPSQHRQHRTMQPKRRMSLEQWVSCCLPCPLRHRSGVQDTNTQEDHLLGHPVEHFRSLSHLGSAMDNKVGLFPGAYFNIVVEETSM